MSVPTLAPTVPANLGLRVRPVIESRPPGEPWRQRPTTPVTANQPTLDLSGPADVDPSRPSGAAVSSTVVRARWTVRPRRDLPDAREWGAALALAVLQAMLGQRPLAQLNRWLADDVLSTVTMQQRRHLLHQGRVVRPVLIRSVRVQHPGAEAAEVAAHVVVGTRDSAIAFRLEALGDRWLGTALEFDPRVLR
jgi:hypothetical protein